MMLETACPDANLVVSAHGMLEEAVLHAWWKLDRLELPRRAQKTCWRAVLVSTVVVGTVCM